MNQGENLGARIAQSVARLASDQLIHLPVQVRIPLADASKNYRLLIKPIQVFLHGYVSMV